MSSNPEAVKKYQQTRDAIMLRPTKEKGHQIRRAATDAGMSVQAYILEAVEIRMGKPEG